MPYRPSICLLIIALLTLAACTPTITVRPDAEEPTSAPAQKLPYTVGVYYSPEFSSFEHVRPTADFTFVTTIGAASTDLMSRVFDATFETVVYLDHFPAAETTPALQAVFVPALEKFDYVIGLDPPSKRKSVTFRLTVYSSDGVPVESKTVRGRQPFLKYAYPIPVWRAIDHHLKVAGDRLHDYLASAGMQQVLDSLGQRRISSAAAIELDVSAAAADADPGAHQVLLESGLLRVSYRAYNRGHEPALVRESDIRLVLPGGRAIAPVNPSLVQGELRRIVTSVDGFVLFGYAVGVDMTGAEAVSRAVQSSVQWESMQHAIAGTGMIDIWLGPGEHAERTLLFAPADDTPPFEQADLTLWALRPSATAVAFDGVGFDTRVSGIRYLPLQ